MNRGDHNGQIGTIAKFHGIHGTDGRFTADIRFEDGQVVKHYDCEFSHAE